MKILIYILLCASTYATAQTTTITVLGNCGMCHDRIETAALTVIGVTKADYSIDQQLLSVEHAPFFSVAELHQKMAGIGHDTDQLRASRETYDNLHGCCKYDRAEDSTTTNTTATDSYVFTGPDASEPHDGHDHNGEIAGMIYEQTSDGKLRALVGANVGWIDESMGTYTDDEGHWTLPYRESEEMRIVVSYVGFEADTIDMTGERLVAITLSSNHVMDAVEIKYRKRSTTVSFVDPIKSQRITQKELCKAACCNLSESFETTPAVDVSTTDAVTGTRKIEMLGLAGPNIQVMRENMPYIRGLAAIVGMEYTPGPWIEGIQLNLGTGSVVNGPESITGQINVETKKPIESERFYMNLFANGAGRLEANLNGTQKVNDKWSTATLLHGKTLRRENDRNNDGFLDVPLSDHVIATHRWKYTSGDGLHGQIGIKGNYKNLDGGQVSTMEGQTWRSNMQTSRAIVWAKIGKVFQERPYASIGLQLSGTYHEQDADFGGTTQYARRFDGVQQSLYANLIYQTIIGNTDHTLKTGTSFSLDDIKEQLDGLLFDRRDNRREVMPGAFVEYQYTGSESFSLVAGLRADHHNLFGAFVTPRLHVKYNPTESQALRLAIGRGQRTASIFAEHIGLFASNRSINVVGQNNGNPYGLVPDTGWNLGLNYTIEGSIAGIPTLWGIDYYYTVFTSQVVADWETSGEISFYALDGRSQSHSIQTQAEITPAKGLDIRLAYRFNDPRTDYRNSYLLNPLIAQHRAFTNIAYETESGWMFDITANWIGQQRLPNTDASPQQYQLEAFSPDIRMVNTQVTKKFGESLDIYVGGENIFNFRQENPIVAVNDVASPFFDSSMIWGPVLGGNVYIGLRYRLL